MDRLVRNIEILAGYSLGIVALLIFAEITLRYVFNVQIPDVYAVAAQLQGIAIFWGFATATFSGRHITVDIVWEACPPKIALAIDTLADLITAAFFAALAYMLYLKVGSLHASGEVTNTVKLLLWPFLAIAGFGIACSVVLGIIRIILRLQGRTPVEAGLNLNG